GGALELKRPCLRPAHPGCQRRSAPGRSDRFATRRASAGFRIAFPARPPRGRACLRDRAAHRRVPWPTSLLSQGSPEPSGSRLLANSFRFFLVSTRREALLPAAAARGGRVSLATIVRSLVGVT